MELRAVILSLLAASALPVVGLITGRVVGDFFLRGDFLGTAGAASGVLVYMLALASSYSHLRHYYKGYEAPGVRASWALALAVEVATFYLSFSYVVIRSPWAFWGSLIGAFVVFWGNFSSMYEARFLRLKGQLEADSRPPVALVHRVKQWTVHSETHVQGSEAVLEDDPLSGRQSATAVHRMDDPHSGRQSPVAVHQTADPQEPTDDPLSGREPMAPVHRDARLLEVLRLALIRPVGPSEVSRSLGIAKSSAVERLRRLERMGLLARSSGGYAPTEEGRRWID